MFNSCINSNLALKIDFGEIYPMSDSVIGQVIKCFGITPKSVTPLNQEMILVKNKLEGRDLVIVNRRKAIKTPTVKSIIKSLNDRKVSSSYILCSGIPNTGIEYLGFHDGHDAIPIKNIIHPDYQNTVPVLIGRYANSVEKASEKRYNVTLRLKIGQYVNKGLPNVIGAKDIYNFIDGKSGKSNPMTELKADAFECIIKSFMEIAQKRMVDPKKWKEMNTRNGVFDILKRLNEMSEGK